MWKNTLSEILFGKRGITKMSHLWISAAVILLSGSLSDLGAGFFGTIYLFFAVLFKIMFSIQINDLCDQSKDEAMGKQRWIFHLPIHTGITISIALIAAGYIIVILKNGSMQVILAYTATILLGMFYSLPPIRFKERGAWGPMAYALSATIIYVVVPWAWFNGGLVVLVLLCLAVFSDKWVQLHFHQVVDYQSDMQTGVQTYAVKAGIKRARKTLEYATSLASIFIFSLVIYLIVIFKHDAAMQLITLILAASVLAASAIYKNVTTKNAANETALVKELPWFYLGLAYLVFCVLPPVLFIFLALKEPLMWILVVLSTFSFLGLTLQSIRYKYT